MTPSFIENLAHKLMRVKNRKLSHFADVVFTFFFCNRMEVIRKSK